MDYSKFYFGKDLANLIYQDIEKYFQTAKEESDKIEFKSFATKYSNTDQDLSNIKRAICAFLNSEGGIIIWGAPEGKSISGTHIKTFQGNLSPLQQKMDKDWLINKISDSITPLPVGIRLNCLEKNNKYLYIFEIQSSTYKPHMFGNIYWIRLDGQTKPAPHYLVEALFKQITYPNLEGFIKFKSISQNREKIYLDISIVIFNYSKLQNEEKVSFRLLCGECYFFHYFAQTLPHKDIYYNQGQELVYQGHIDVLHFGTPAVIDEKLVIMKGDPKFEAEKKVNLLLSFGGKKSPIKTSFYTLDFNKVDWDNTVLPNYLITEIEENKLIIDKIEEINPNKGDELKQIIGR